MLDFSSFEWLGQWVGDSVSYLCNAPTAWVFDTSWKCPNVDSVFLIYSIGFFPLTKHQVN
jgi:hypothetical protein